jgi:hypothetical protein
VSTKAPSASIVLSDAQLSTTTPSTPSTIGTTTCGPLFGTVASSTVLYCSPVPAPSPCASFTPGSLFINGNANPLLGSTSTYQADAGIGTQFLPITWSGANSNIYVISLTPSQYFSVIVRCG